MANDFINLPQSIDLNIAPVQAQTTIYLAKGIPWDNKYVHVRPFASKSDLLAYVQSMTPSGYTITQSAPVRTGRLSVSVKANEAVAMKFNYMAFQNLPYDSEWHFAFITNVIWKSNSSVTIEFELDVFQECWYTADLKPCFIERAHIAKSDDTVGANVVPDNIETGELYCYNHESMFFSDSAGGDLYIGGWTSDLPVEGDLPDGFYPNRKVNGVYSGLYFFSSKNASTIADIIQSYDDVGKSDAIETIFMYPDICETEGDPVGKEYHQDYTEKYGYTPKNNKIYTYPYSYLIVDDNGGNSNVYRNEMTSGEYFFKSYGILNIMPSVYTVPQNYNGVQGPNYLYGFVTDNFPMCAWKSDTYRAWLAQTQNTRALSNITGIAGIATGGISAIAGGLTGNAIALGGGIKATGSGIQTILGNVATMLDKQMLPDQTKGNVGGSARTGMDLDRVDFYFMRPKDNMLKVIDDFWSAFGYPIHEVATPAWNNRSSWNYLKTVDCGFTADAELELLQRFRAIFDNGVTLWHTNDVGNYNLSNN